MNRYNLNRFVPAGLMALAAAVLLAPAPADATPYVVKLVQQGSNVVATGSGALDLSGMLYYMTTSAAGPQVAPSYPFIETGPGGVNVDLYLGLVSGPPTFGAGGNTLATGGTGDEVAFEEGTVVVPAGYVSDTALSSTATWDSATFASLGLTPGTYVWSWGSSADQSFTLKIGNAISTPEPAALGMFGMGLLLIGGFVGVRRRVA